MQSGPSVSTVKRVNCDKMEEKSIQIFILYEKSFSVVFWEEELLVGATLLPEILGHPAPLQRNRRFWTNIRS